MTQSKLKRVSPGLGVALALVASAWIQRCSAEEPPAPAVDARGDALPQRADVRFGSLRFRTFASARQVFFCGPKLLGILGPDRVATILDWPSGVRRRAPRPDGAGILGAISSPSGDLLILSRADGRLTLISPGSGAGVAEYPMPYRTAGMAVSASGDAFACAGDDGAIHVVGARDGKEIRSLAASKRPLVAVAWSRDDRIAAVDADGKSVIWGAGPEPLSRITLPPGSVRIRFAPDGKTLYGAGADGELTVWDPLTGKRKCTLQADPEQARCIAVSGDGRWIASGGRGGTVKVWEATTWKLVREWRAHAGWLDDADFSPDSASLVSCGEDRRIRVWDVEKGTDLDTAVGHSENLNSVALSPDGKVLATGGGDGRVVFWEAATGKDIATYGPFADPVQSIAWAGDSALVYAAAGRKIKAIRADSGEVAATMEAGTGAIRSVAWVRGRGVVEGGTDTLARLLEEKTGRVISEFPGHKAMVRGVACDEAGTQLATAGADGRIALWTFAEGKPAWLDPMTGSITSVCFSRDGKTLVSGGSDAVVRLWDTESRKLILKIAGYDGEVTAVALSPDGSKVAATTVGNSTRICDTRRGVEVAILRGSGGVIRGVCWGSDGTTLFTAMFDTTALRWKLPAK